MAYVLRDLADIVQMVVGELKLEPSNTAEIARIKRDINLVYLDEVVPFTRWKWLTGHTKVQHKPFYGVGTVALTPGSATITFSVAPPTSLAGQQFALDTFEEAYEIATHTANSTTATLTTPYTGSLTMTASFKAWSDVLPLPNDLAETISARHDFMRDPMRAVGLQELRRMQAEGGRVRGRPVSYATQEFSDGDADTRYRILRVYPAISDNTTTLSLDYKKEATALELDGDEPLMPVEDRVVLVYGALERAWRRARNPEEASNNHTLYNNKLSRMAGKVEDSQDRPQLTTSSVYMAAKRRNGYRSTTGAPPNMAGGSYSAPTYAKDIQIDGANITADVSVAPLVTIDGRDISADGLELDDHLAATSDAHPASAITVTGLSYPDVQQVLTSHEAQLADAVTQIELDAHINDAVAAHAASAIGFTPTGATTSTDVQAAIAEVQVDATTGITNAATVATNLSTHEADTGNPHAVTKAQVGLSAVTNDAQLKISSNLSDLNSAATARTNLGLGTMAVKSAISLTTDVSGTLPVSSGGTGQTTQAAALTALAGTQSSGKYLRSDGTNTALDSIHAADVPTLNQNTTGTAAGLSATLAIASGGTGQTSASAAFDALAPTQTGNSGKFITTNGTTTSWASVTAADLYTAKSASYTLTTSDKTIGFTTGSSALTATLPTAVGNSGLILRVVKVDTGTGTVAIATTSAQTIATRASSSIVLSYYQDFVIVQSDGANWIILGKRESSFTTANGAGTITGSAGDYLGSFGGSVSLTPGVYRITGNFGINQASSTNLALTTNSGFYGADGGNNSTVPTALPGTVNGNSDYSHLGVGYVWYFGGSNGSSNNSRNTVTPITFIYTVTSTHTIYLVPRMDFGTAGSATVHVTVLAERLF